MSSRILSIDIQQDQISSVLLTHDFKGVRIVESACVMIDGQTAADDFFTAAQNSLVELLKEMGNGYDRCVVSLPSPYFFFRILELPFKNRKKNSQILSFELENYLPCPVEEVESDFYLFNKKTKNSAKTHTAGTASIKTHDLEQFKAIFDACHIHPDVITTGTGYSSALAFCASSDIAALSLFIHVEKDLLAIYVIKSQEINYIRTILLNSTDPVKTVKTSVSHTLLSFNDRFDNLQELDDIVLSGTAAFMADLISDLETEMAVSVYPFNIFTTVKHTASAGHSASQMTGADQNAVAMGVNDIKGGEGFHFNRQISGLSLLYHDNRANIIALAVLSFLLFLALTINPVLQTRRMEKNIQKIDAQIVQVFQSCFPDVTTIVDPVHQMRVMVNALQEKKNMDLLNAYPLCIDLLNEISRALPATLDIDFTRLVRTENNLLVTGSADQFKTIDIMKNQFKNIALFKEVDINSASMDKMDKRVTFNIKILL